MSFAPQLRPLRVLNAAGAKAWTYLLPIGSFVCHTYSRRPRWARWVVVVLATLFGFSIILNGLLNLGRTRPFLASLISVNPQSLNVDYRRAWFFVPTLVHIRNLEVRGSDRNVEWQLEIDEARVTVDLLALLRREFHATKVRARGIGFRLRQKMNVSAATDDEWLRCLVFRGFKGLPS
jgi:hypothetical protein